MKIITAYDGTFYAKTALRYGLKKAGEKKGEVILLQVFDRSAFIDYDAGPKAEEMARSEAAQQLEEARKIAGDAPGFQVTAFRIITEEGDPEQVIKQYAERERPDLVLVPPRYKKVHRSLSCPVCVIPGVILVPVDSSISPLMNIDRIHDEAMDTRSTVLLAGIVPVHLYSREEGKELEAVTKETLARINAIGKALALQGVETRKIMRSGYPDEEILKAAEENDVSLILIPSAGDAPSELNKAAAIILEEPEGTRSPVLVLSSAGTA
ncbi:MAG TPA: universal stress protein [Nitrospirota bacterium]|nr:universal stress protein [Nitrospirota bacterium]